jgi:hypothetical protein
LVGEELASVVGAEYVERGWSGVVEREIGEEFLESSVGVGLQFERVSKYMS